MDTLKAVIVDDEQWVRTLLLKMIDWKKLGFTVVGDAENGRFAIKICKRFRPHVVITDVRMPDMDGLDLIKVLQEELPEAFCVIVSGYDEFEYAQRALRYGVVDYIVKPVNKEEVESVLKEVKERVRVKRRRNLQIKRLRNGSQKLEAMLTETGCDNLLEENMDPRIERTVNYLNEHYMENPSLDEIASVAIMNRTYFSEMFKKETGCGFVEYLNTLRIDKAKVLLEQSELKISEIAESLGCSNANYFSKLFKINTGLTPENYRNKHLKM